MYLLSLIKEECCGCTACEQICHVQAISMKSDDEGFLYPIKNAEKCVNCGVCEKICPYSKPSYELSSEPDVFAAYNKDYMERGQSSSGGLFYVIAKQVLALNGVVFGAILDEKLKVIHKSASSVTELSPLKGSKYVQSDLKNSYLEIREMLKQGRMVYFTGTPCQVAGLKSFLRKTYLNLLTSDLVCHGTPSQLLFDKHLEYLKNKNNSEIVGYQFRDNMKWNACEIVDYRHKDGTIQTKKMPTYDLSSYLYSFMNSYTHRLSCYNCKFSRIPRQGDITLADFWGVKKYFPNIDTTKGVSLVLLNSEKGLEFWNLIKERLFFSKSNIADASAFNQNLISITPKPEIRNSIYREVHKRGYRSVAENEFRCPNWWRVYLIYMIDRYTKNTILNKSLKIIHKLFK